MNIKNKTGFMAVLLATSLVSIESKAEDLSNIVTDMSAYSAKQDIKITNILSDFDKIDSALMSHFLDTERFPIELEANPSLLNAQDLINNNHNFTGWSGPYLDFKPGSHKNYLKHPEYGDILISHWPKDPSTPKCYKPGSCYVYVCFTQIPKNLIKEIGIKIDGKDTTTPDAKFKFSDSGLGCRRSLPSNKKLVTKD